MTKREQMAAMNDMRNWLLGTVVTERPHVGTEICLRADDLRAALADIEIAEKRGFMHCLAVVKVVHIGPMLDETVAEYVTILEQAHPTNGHMKWGRGQNITKRYKWKNGALVPLKEGK